MKRLISVLLLLCLIAGLVMLPSFACSKTDENTMDALNSLGLFFGTNAGYELDGSLTLLLRVLGCSGTGKGAKFVWNSSYAFAKSMGLIDYAEEDKNFTRGEAVQIFWKALAAKLADGSSTMAKKLVTAGIFTAEELADTIAWQRRAIQP